MLLDAIVAFIIIKLFELEGLQVLAAVAAVTIIRTCHNINWLVGAIEEGLITMESEEEDI
mgnify:CR=1 FL=1